MNNSTAEQQYCVWMNVWVVSCSRLTYNLTHNSNRIDELFSIVLAWNCRNTMSPNVVLIFDCSVRWLRRTCHRLIDVVLIVAMEHLLSHVELYHAEVLQMIDFYGDRINRMAFGHHSNQCHLKGVARHFACVLVNSFSRFLSDFCFSVGAATALRSKHSHNLMRKVWIC